MCYVLESTFRVLALARKNATKLSLLLVFAVAPAHSQAADITLKPGDQLQITVFGHDDLSGEFELDAAGRLSFPLVEDIAAEGLTLDGLERAIVDALRPDFLVNPRVNIQLMSLRPFYILGEVQQPGSYPCTSDMTLLRAIAVAGGFTYRARTKRIVIRRVVDGGEERIRGKESTLIQPGDVIEVPERFF